MESCIILVELALEASSAAAKTAIVWFTFYIKRQRRIFHISNCTMKIAKSRLFVMMTT